MKQAHQGQRSPHTLQLAPKPVLSVGGVAVGYLGLGEEADAVGGAGVDVEFGGDAGAVEAHGVDDVLVAEAVGAADAYVGIADFPRNILKSIYGGFPTTKSAEPNGLSLNRKSLVVTH